MAVQISKKRKVSSWARGPGDCGAARVRAFSGCRRGTRSSVPCSGKWLGPRGISAGCGWRWIECGGPSQASAVWRGKGADFRRLRAESRDEHRAPLLPRRRRVRASLGQQITMSERVVLGECEPSWSLQILTAWLWEGVGVWVPPSGPECLSCAGCGRPVTPGRSRGPAERGHRGRARPRLPFRSPTGRAPYPLVVEGGRFS